MKWPILRLEQLAAPEPASIKIGPFGSQLKKSELVFSGIHVLGIENVLASSFDGLGSRYITNEKFDTLRSVEVKPGDILITMMGTIGAVCVVPPGINTSIMDSHLLRFRPNPSMCRPEYVAWLIKGGSTIRDFLSAHAHGSIMQGLNSSIVRALPAPLPPLGDQDRIVKLLDEADELRKLRARADWRTADLIPALFHEMFGDPESNPKSWAKKRVKEVVRLINGRAFKPIEWGKTGLPIIRIQNLKDSEAPFNFFDGDYDAKHFTGKGVLLISWAGQLISFGVHVWDGPEGLLNQHIFRAEPILEAENEFLRYALAHVVEQAKARFHGIEMKHLTKGTLEEAEILFPPLSCQKEFASRVAETRELKAKQAASRQRLDSLFQSVLHRAFRGEL